MKPVPPLASPKVPADDGPEQDTGEYPMVTGQVLKAKLKKAARHERRVSLGQMVAFLGVCFGALFEVRREAQAQVDAGLSLQEQKHAALQKQVDHQDATIRRTEDKVDRLDRKVDVVLDALRVPERKRPPRADAGGGE